MGKKKFTKQQLAIIRRNHAQKNNARSTEKTERVEAPYPHFRNYRKSGHPALIVGEQKGKKTDKQGNERETEEYRYRKVMHGETEGGRTNETVTPNPNPNDPKPMRIAKRVRHDEKKNFGNKPLPWKYPKKE